MDEMIYKTKIKEFKELIKKEEEKINESKRRIFKLKKDLSYHKDTCDHTYKDGKSAMKDTSYWVSDIETYICDWTGEEMEEDHGYTEYEKTCQICLEEFKY